MKFIPIIVNLNLKNGHFLWCTICQDKIQSVFKMMSQFIYILKEANCV